MRLVLVAIDLITKRGQCISVAALGVAADEHSGGYNMGVSGDHCQKRCDGKHNHKIEARK